MKLELQKMVINRFLSFGDNVTVPLKDQGLVRVEGVNLDDKSSNSNMAGKSSIIEALVWCLFGQTIRGLKHDKVVNRFLKKNCYVETHFRVHSISYKIIRFRKHKDFKNGLQLWRKHKLLSYRHETETQKRIEAVLGCDFKAFVNSVVFGGLDLLKPFARLTDAEQKKLLESFLHFEQFDYALRRTKELLAETKEVQAANNLKLEHQRGKVETVREKIVTLRESEQIFEVENQKEFDKVQVQLKRLKEPRPLSRSKVDLADHAVHEATYSFTEEQLQARDIKQRLKTVSKAKADRTKLVGKKCPVCGRVVSEENLQLFVKHITQDRVALEKELRSKERKVKKLERRLVCSRVELKRRQKQLHNLELIWERYISTEKALKQQEETLRENRAKSSAPFSLQIEKQTIRYSRQLKKLLVCEQAAKRLNQKFEDLQFWEMGFGNSGVKALVVRNSLPAMNAKLQEYANEIFKGSAELEFKPTKATARGNERELFHLHYSGKHGAASYAGESSGGRRRVDICVLMVFSWLSNLCNCIFIDELLDGLDASGREAVLEILSRQRRSVFVISHQSSVKENLSNSWVVTKKNGISTLRVH